MAVEIAVTPPKSADHAAARMPRVRHSGTQPGLAVWQDSVFLQVHGIVMYYLLLMLAAFWVLLDFWSGSFHLLRALGLNDAAVQQPMLRSVGYALIGAMLGSILCQIRTLFRRYLKSQTYDQRWLGKYVSAPWESMAMSLVVLALLRGGLAAFGGAAEAGVTPTSNFATFGLGALVGFGMRDVVGWMGHIVGTVFVTGDNGATAKAPLGEAEGTPEAHS